MAAVEELKATFKRWDTDGSGSITKDELFAIFKSLDPTFSATELDDMMAEADVNKDGKIDVNEFIDWCTGGAGGEMSIPMGELWVEKLELCRQDALCTYSGWSFKVKKHFDQMKERLSSEAFTTNAVSMFMGGQDQNNDGLITFEEAYDLIEPTLEAWYAHDPKFKKKEKLDKSLVRTAFDAHDTAAEGKGKMGKEEFGNLVKYLQVISAAAMMQDTVSMWEDQD